MRWAFASLLLTIAMMSPAAIAQDSSPEREPAAVVGEDDETLLRSREIMANPDSIVDRVWAESIRTPQDQDGLQEIADQGAALAEQAIERTSDEFASILGPVADKDREPPPARFRVFVTQAMSDEELRGIGEMVVARGDTVMVLRGFLPEQNMSDLYGRLQRVFGDAIKGEAFSGLALDPPRFRELDIQQAPAIAMYDAEGQPVGYATGVTNPEWLASQLAGGKKGFRGQNGPVQDIAEEDLIERMQRNARNYDWAGAKDRAQARFFTSNVPSHAFPEARVPRVRAVDPSFVVQDPVLLPDGQLLVAAGTRINPLEHVPFNTVVVVFDPARPEQLAVVHEVIRRNPGRSVKVLASSLESVGDFDGYGRLMDKVGRRVYMLPDPLREQFRIERVPSVVSADGTVFRVEEIPPSQVSAMEGAADVDPES